MSPHIQSQITARTFLITQNATHFSVIIFNSTRTTYSELLKQQQTNQSYSNIMKQSRAFAG
jgi:hypothetical protein